MFPYFFTVTSHIIITATHGAGGDPDRHRLRLLEAQASTSSSCSCRAACRRCSSRSSPSIEVLSFISRPIILSIRLFANMLAGHITLKVFAGFVVHARLGRRRRHPRRDPAARRDRRADRARVPGRGAAGLRLRHSDQPLPQRRPSPRPLDRPNHSTRLSTGALRMDSGSSKVPSAPASPASAWAAPASASATSSATTSPARSAIRPPPTGQFGRLIFGFAVTEALGIFSLLVALILLFALSRHGSRSAGDGQRHGDHDGADVERGAVHRAAPRAPSSRRRRSTRSSRRSTRRPSPRSSSGSRSPSSSSTT